MGLEERHVGNNPAKSRGTLIDFGSHPSILIHLHGSHCDARGGSCLENACPSVSHQRRSTGVLSQLCLNFSRSAISNTSPPTAQAT